VSAAEIERYGRVLERYYGRLDSIVERVMGASDESTILFVTSSHGIEPSALPRRLVAMAMGREAGAGTHDGGPVGFLFARGPEILSGHSFGKGSITDVVPTALYALGQPVARDLDGIIRTGIFTSKYTFEHPVVIIDSYESGWPSRY
jgi:arylsulfatase A-like enzyme